MSRKVISFIGSASLGNIRPAQADASHFSSVIDPLFWKRNSKSRWFFCHDIRFGGLAGGGLQTAHRMPLSEICYENGRPFRAFVAGRRGALLSIALAFAPVFFVLFISLKTYGGEDGLIVWRTKGLQRLKMKDKATLHWVILDIAGIRQNERRMTATAPL